MLTEIVWKVTGETIPSDHVYGLFGALCERGVMTHGEQDGRQLLPIRGDYVPVGALRITPASKLIVRLPAAECLEVLDRDLSGPLIFAGVTVYLDHPIMRKVLPASKLFSRMVTTKKTETAEELGAAVESQLRYYEVSGVVSVGKQRSTKVSGHVTRGWEVTISELSDADSLKLLKHGIGGQRHFGCGVFVPC